MMQVISRAENEGLVIGDDIQVTVLKVAKTEVRLAISSPRECPSYREEILHWEPSQRVRSRALQLH